MTTQLTIEDYLKKARFEGPTDNARDCDRLGEQLLNIYNLIKDGQWRTLEELETETGYPQASISAQLRHLRKTRFGMHTIDKRRRDNGAQWEYKFIR